MTKTRCPLLPVGEFLCIEPDAPISTVGAILLVHPEAQQRGIVRAVSPETQDLAVGDHTIFHKFVGTTVEVNGRSWLLVKERDCLAILV